MDPPGTQEIALFDSRVYDWHTAPMDTSTPPASIAPEDWAAIPVVVQQFLRSTLALHQQQIAQLRARIAELEARLNQHSQNSSKPPSAAPPSAPPRPDRVPRGRTPGGQAGHPRHERPIPDPEQITTTAHHYPSTCQQCGADVTASQRDACAIQTQYIWEIPAVQPPITVHHYHTVCCPDCGELVTATRPPDVPPGGFGPRTVAVVSMLHGRYRISQRQVANLLAALFHFGCPSDFCLCDLQIDDVSRSIRLRVVPL